MSSSNYRRNKAALDAFRKDLEAEMGDLSEIDIKLLNQAVNEGVRDIKKNTPGSTGHLRKSWRSAPAVKGPSGVKKVLVNMADYSEFVNYGHRVCKPIGKDNRICSGKPYAGERYFLYRQAADGTFQSRDRTDQEGTRWLRVYIKRLPRNAAHLCRSLRRFTGITFHRTWNFRVSW